jgi:hypothetical protein
VTDQCFSPGAPVSSTNKTDGHDITEILLKMALNTIKQTSKAYPYPHEVEISLVIPHNHNCPNHL